ncbi:MAG: phosphotransferase [Anaerolineae bacterium]|nr:phosphotransferase [Anaerolineae bacterium]
MLDPAIFEAGARAYGLDPAALESPANRFGLSGSLFLDLHTGEERLLKFSRSSGVHTVASFRDAMAFINWLADQGLSASRRYLSLAGHLAEEVGTGGQWRVVTYFRRAPGHVVDPTNPAEWNEAHFRAMGRYAGRLHALAKKYVSWRGMPEGAQAGRDRAAGYCHILDSSIWVPGFMRTGCRDPEVFESWQREWAPPESWTIDRAHYGICHGDFEWRNTLVDGDTLLLVDWDQCHCGWFGEDVAWAVYAGAAVAPALRMVQGETPSAEDVLPNPQGDAFSERFLEAFLAGYEAETTVGRSLLGRLPQHIFGVHVWGYLVVLRLAGDNPAWQPYLAELRARILAGVPPIRLHL